VQFEPDSAKLIADSKDLLDEVAKALDEHPEIKLLSIEGHTDSRMSTRHNQKLSVQRANSVRSYLIKKGIAKDRLVTKGFGETQPVADNSTWKGRFENRRVHLKIVKRDESGDEPRGATKLDAEPADGAETKAAPKHARNTPKSSGKKKAEAESE
jgi:flagellar motor protein MotB